MAKHYFNKAKKEFDRLVAGQVPDDSIVEHIDNIRGYLHNDGISDVAALMPGKTTSDVEAIFTDATKHADAAQNVAAIRGWLERIYDEAHIQGNNETKKVDVDEKARANFSKVGIDVTLLADNYQPTIKELETLVATAEEKLRRDFEKRAQTREGRKI